MHIYICMSVANKLVRTQINFFKGCEDILFVPCQIKAKKNVC